MIPVEFLEIYITALVFLFGACWGSFLNVCIYRIPEELSVIHPSSRCPHCLTPIAWYDNIPILGWLKLRGKCRSCQAPISPRYMLVELLTAVLFLLVWMTYGLQLKSVIYCFVIFGLLLATFIDFDYMIIPDRVSIGGMWMGPVFSMLVPALHGELSWLLGLKSSLIGMAAGFGSLWLVSKIGAAIFKKDAMGFGDVKLLGAIGAFMGWHAVLFVIMASSLLGSVVGIGLIATGRSEASGRIPYGPYIALAAVIWLLGGYEIWDWYIGLITGQPIQ